MIDTPVSAMSHMPKGLLEAPLIQRILHRFIDQLEQSRARLAIKISSKTTPELFDFDRTDIQYLWLLIESLAQEHHVLTISLPPQSLGKEPYDGATLWFEQTKEALVREWLQRPKILSYTQQWACALAETADVFNSEQLSILAVNPIKKKAHSAKKILESFFQIGQQLKQSPFPLSCRTLSARCFNGDSKILDNHEGLLRQLFPDGVQQLKSRPILLSVAMPDSFKRVLFIENQETFLECVAHCEHPLFCHTALVYSAGFRSTAERIRKQGGVVFTCVNTSKASSILQFEAWWYKNKDDIQSLSCCFWGDLDYSGMVILASLRKIFFDLTAWQPGYEALLSYHQKGISHSPSDAKKDAQTLPEITGCAYADEILLPLLRRSQQFVDQEAVNFEDLIL